MTVGGLLILLALVTAATFAAAAIGIPDAKAIGLSFEFAVAGLLVHAVHGVFRQ